MAAPDDLWLIGCLNAILDPTLGARNQAEKALEEASNQKGYGVALAKITVNTEISTGLRQLAAVLLKQYVKKHWEGDDTVPAIVSRHDKDAIRKLLPLALGDPEKKIQTAVGMAIGCIAVSDWPDEWPELMTFILACINDRSDINKVNGGMRCLSLFACEVDERQLPHLVPVLFPTLYDIISTPSVYCLSTRRQALIVLHSSIALMGFTMGRYQSETKALFSSSLKAWMEQFSAILLTPIHLEEPESWCIKAETIRALKQTVLNFPKLAFNEFQAVLGPVWQTFVTDLQVYQRAAIEGVEESKPADADGTDQSVESFAIQLLEFFLTLIGHGRYTKVMSKSVKDLPYFVIGYMQMTEEQVELWSSDASEFLAEEESMACSCRTSGILLLQEMVELYEKNASLAILEAIGRRFEDADKAKSQGETGWWKLREAAILALGSCIEVDKNLPSFNLDVIFNRILNEDLSQGMKLSPFLYGRALWAVAKFSTCISGDKQDKFFLTAIDGLSDPSCLPVMVGSCQALSTLLPVVASQTAQPYIKTIYAALATLLQQGSEETMHVVLDALHSAIKADKEHTHEVEAMLSPILLNVWARYMADPLIGVDALNVLEAIETIPGCVEPLAARVLPAITSILTQSRTQESGQVAGALDLLTMILKNPPPNVLKHAYDAVFGSIIAIVMHTDDHGELQNATECLARFVKAGGENLLAWATDGESAMKMLLGAAARLLNPQTDTSGALYSGTFIVQLIEKLSSHMAPYLRELITALVARMELVNLKGSLIFVLAKLVHMSAPNYGSFIELLQSIPSEVHEDALTSVMWEWTKCHGEVHGSYQIKVSTTALASLLATGHPSLSEVKVQGRLIEACGIRIKTRSRSKVQPDDYTRVSALQKIFSILAQGLIEESLANIFSEGSDEWEEMSSPDRTDMDDGMPASKPLSSVFQSASLYDQVLNESDDDGENEASDDESDPINKINLKSYLTDFMKRFSQEAPHIFSEFFKGLSDQEKKAVQSSLAK